MNDEDFINFVATHRVLEMTQAIAAFHNRNKHSCYKFWVKHRELGNIHYFHNKAEKEPIKGVRFCALHENCIKRFGVLDDRVWPLKEGAQDIHVATSVFVMDTIVHGNPAHSAIRVEPTDIDKIYGTSLTTNVPWIIKPHLGGRKACVFRVLVGDEPSEVTRTLDKMRDADKVAKYMETGEFGLLLLVSLPKYREEMQAAVKHLTKDARIFVGVGPTSATLLKHLGKKR